MFFRSAVRPLFFRPSLAPRLFSTRQPLRMSTYTIELDPNTYDPAQIELMEERLILLDNDDKATGEGSKKDCAHSATSRRVRSAILTCRWTLDQAT